MSGLALSAWVAHVGHGGACNHDGAYWDDQLPLSSVEKAELPDEQVVALLECGLSKSSWYWIVIDCDA